MVTELTSAAEVLVATGHDPYVRGTLRRADVMGWAGEGAVLWRATDAEERVPYVMCLGAPPAAARLVAELLDQLPNNQRVTLPRGTAPLLPAWVAQDGTDWDFRWLDEPPPRRAREQDVTELAGDHADEEVAELLLASSERASARPGEAHVRRWFGVREDGRLLACVADTSAATGVGHLSSIATHPDGRGRGLGAAVTAALARRLFEEGCDLVTLGMYADNAAGRALYDSLGMHDEHRFTSGPLQVRSRW